MSIQFKSFVCIVVLFIISLSISLKAEESNKTIRKIEKYNGIFQSAAKSFDIDVNLLKSIVYVERTMNYDWKDDALDEILAISGMNSSIGFCQVKLKTAYWIETQLNDSKSIYYPGDKYKGLLKVSKSPDEIIKKLYSDSLNILYAAAYIKIIQSRWENAGFPITDRPDITGTLYFTGLFRRTGEERKPRVSPDANQYGIKVKENIRLFQ